MSTECSCGVMSDRAWNCLPPSVACTETPAHAIECAYSPASETLDMDMVVVQQRCTSLIAVLIVAGPSNADKQTKTTRCAKMFTVAAQPLAARIASTWTVYNGEWKARFVDIYDRSYD